MQKGQMYRMKTEELTLHIMHGYDSLESPDGQRCFGCYISEDHEAYVADNIPTDQLFHTIAHEYFHYLQDIEGDNFDEEEANAFGYSIFTPCYQQGIIDTINAFENTSSFISYPNGETKEYVISVDEWEELKNKLLENRGVGMK